MSERFFCETPVHGPRLRLTGDEARHLATVMRAAVGDETLVFDGGGAEYVCRVARIGKSEVECDVLCERRPEREATRRVTIASALPKGDRQKFLIEKLTELGVARWQPLRAERGVAEPVESALARIRRGVIEASKQCGRNTLLEVLPPRAVSDFFADSHPEPNVLGWLADPGGAPLGNALRAQLAAEQAAEGDRAPAAVTCAIGPEGGFTPGEVAAGVQHGWRLVSLGPRIFRLETAAIACAAALLVT